MADHVVVQQKPTQHYEAISLQLNEIKLCWVFAAARSLGARGSWGDVSQVGTIFHLCMKSKDVHGGPGTETANTPSTGPGFNPWSGS